MKVLIYSSGILGALSIVSWLLSIPYGFPMDQVLLIVGLVLLLFVHLPFMVFRKFQESKRIDRIIRSYKSTNKEEPIDKKEVAFKGWGMNNSPFRKRKSGLEWSGGNIKGAKAQRPERRSFLN
ncbi:MAG: hypothetical protein JXQ96_04090 [Cyclobacteriaceae bacterium]